MFASLSNVLERLTHSRSRRRRKGEQRRSARLFLEALEDRYVLSGYSTLHDTPLQVNAANGLLAGQGANISVVSYTPQTEAGGNVEINPDGSFDYTPPTKWMGTDYLSYVTSDGSDTYAGMAEVNVYDNAPVANDQNYQVLHDHTLTVSAPSQGLLAGDYDPDGDSISLVSYTQPAAGTISVNPDGTFTYEPTAGWVGTDYFSYTISDGILQSTATVNISVTDQAPVAVSQNYQVLHDHTLTVTNAAQGLLAGDYDPDGDSISLVSYTQPAAGTVSVNPNGTFTYQPTAGWVRTDYFFYTISDGALQTTATVNINVTDQAPVVDDPEYAIANNQILNVTNAAHGLLANAYDPDGDPINILSYSQPSNGSVVVNPDGTFTYTPTKCFSGTDYFSYTVSDGVLAVQAVAQVFIAPANDQKWEWIGPGAANGGDGLWSNPNGTNWLLNGIVAAPNQYPGVPGSATRFAVVQFDKPTWSITPLILPPYVYNTGPATLNVAIGSIGTLEFTNWVNTLTLNNNLSVTGQDIAGDFQLADGSTIALASNTSLTLYQLNGGNVANGWSNGSIVNAAPTTTGTAFRVCSIRGRQP